MGRFLKRIIPLTLILLLALPIAGVAGPCNKAVVILLDVSISNVVPQTMMPDRYGGGTQCTLLEHTVWSLHEALVGEGSTFMDRDDYLRISGFSSAVAQIYEQPRFNPGPDSGCIKKIHSSLDTDNNGKLERKDFNGHRMDPFFTHRSVREKDKKGKWVVKSHKREKTNFEKVAQSIEATVHSIKLGQGSRFRNLAILVVSDGFHDDAKNNDRFKEAMARASTAVNDARRFGRVEIVLLKVGKGEGLPGDNRECP